MPVIYTKGALKIIIRGICIQTKHLHLFLPLCKTSWFFSKLKSSGYIYHQALSPVSPNHGKTTYIFVVSCTSNNLLLSRAKFANVLLLFSVDMGWFHNSSFSDIIHTCFHSHLLAIVRGKKGRIPGGDARNWITYMITTCYYSQYEGPIILHLCSTYTTEPTLKKSVFISPVASKQHEVQKMFPLSSPSEASPAADVVDAYLMLDQRNWHTVTTWHLDDYVHPMCCEKDSRSPRDYPEAGRSFSFLEL